MCDLSHGLHEHGFREAGRNYVSISTSTIQPGLSQPLRSVPTIGRRGQSHVAPLGGAALPWAGHDINEVLGGMLPVGSAAAVSVTVLGRWWWHPGYLQTTMSKPSSSASAAMACQPASWCRG